MAYLGSLLPALCSLLFVSLTLDARHKTPDKGIDEGGLPDPGFPRHEHHLPLARSCFSKQTVKLCQFCFSANEHGGLSAED